ncbi:saponin hydrolase precursor [Colletotrichum musicola]|uniref:Saponin hydrolase n=1 Tax=Colletotrichum musicola TaxID=2175873 RepID=A0A8H6MPD7_9PEZI|nr:saponin hydrolase precursor [Colletotrichum musicola]
MEKYGYHRPGLAFAFLACLFLFQVPTAASPPPPNPEKFDIVELPLPPVISRNETGACTELANPKRNGCIAQNLGSFQSGGFTSDGNHVLVNVEYIGSPSPPDPASAYEGQQLIIVKTDGSTFPNGDAWKCISCEVPPENRQGIHVMRDYPQAFRACDKVLWGHNIVDCRGHDIWEESCTPDRTRIYPIHWDIAEPRELRIHPGGRHMAWSSFTGGGSQATFFGRLQFNYSPGGPRYDLVDPFLLQDPQGTSYVSIRGDEIHLNETSIEIGELRAFSGTGDEILYLGNPHESGNMDIFAVHLVTGKVRRLTNHPGYVDPIGFSFDNEWFLVMDTQASKRMDFYSAMRGVPPLVDLVVVGAISATRNNGQRRFFQPWLIDSHAERGDYYGQQINEGDGSKGSASDPNWNGRADPYFSPDGTKIVYWQDLVTPPYCDGINPLPCPESTTDGGRVYRIMLARRLGVEPKPPSPVFEVPATIPWATPFTAGTTIRSPFPTNAGNYTLYGRESGYANVSLTPEVPVSALGLQHVSVVYHNYSDGGAHFIDGPESATRATGRPNPWDLQILWESDLVQTGAVEGTKKTSPGGFNLEIVITVNNFTATGTLTTTIDGVRYEQPANGS